MSGNFKEPPDKKHLRPPTWPRIISLEGILTQVIDLLREALRRKTFEEMKEAGQRKKPSRQVAHLEVGLSLVPGSMSGAASDPTWRQGGWPLYPVSVSHCLWLPLGGELALWVLFRWVAPRGQGQF